MSLIRTSVNIGNFTYNLSRLRHCTGITGDIDLTAI
jgi:hypothetical protein